MNGAESLVHTLLGSGVDVCFANPGTSEMHFVAALDRIDGMRCVLGLFEGVITGAADGYGRMRDRPAATLLHLGPGLANGLANLHDAKRAHSPIVNIVGDHATYHRQYDAPLTSDVEGTARPYSHWVRTAASASEVTIDAAEAVAVACTLPGRIATLILPADTAWSPAAGIAAPAAAAAEPGGPDGDRIRTAVEALRGGERVGIVLGGRALRTNSLRLAGQIAAKTGARLLGPYAPPRIERGAGRVAIEPIPYAVGLALPFLAEFDRLLLIGGEAPVAFFAYPDKPSVLTPPGCVVDRIAGLEHDLAHVLEWLADEVNARSETPLVAACELPPPAIGKPTPAAVTQSIAALMPANTIVVDESVSSGQNFIRGTHGARPHDFMKNVGGSIGFGLPAAVGCAIACPDRKVLCLEADGSGMYTVQALWTMARESLDVTTVIFSNRTYATLSAELRNVGAGAAGPRARDMLEIGRPDLDWCCLARSMGVPAEKASDMETFNRLLHAGLTGSGPSLIEVPI